MTLNHLPADIRGELQYRNALCWVLANKVTRATAIAEALSITDQEAKQLLERMERDEVVAVPIFTGGAHSLLASSQDELPDFYGTDALLPAATLLRIANHLAGQDSKESVSLLRELFALKPGMLDKQRLYANATSIPVQADASQ
ncbi:hypothetical protein [Ectopseudomonas mendocina]|uniref:Uncharacterized protein n=1 Tax=Ectopseudomonas mendocina S5.2 TaxID=1225174 RepID=A0ABM5W3E7_ECTME|nr:hypothetical protein [Pseudomonas mendocina]ALN21754.1 hypothetical protein DW68_024050 [Pseudomonas mendocina S5.2]KER98187.1 hypothetical protein HN51_25675 [Pseudomonas mendocina]